jgi:hypothetical protein
LRGVGLGVRPSANKLLGLILEAVVRLFYFSLSFATTPACVYRLLASSILLIKINMAISSNEKSEVQAILQLLLDATAPAPRNRKRRLADMFLELVDREAWAEYYEVFA